MGVITEQRRGSFSVDFDALGQATNNEAAGQGDKT